MDGNHSFLEEIIKDFVRKLYDNATMVGIYLFAMLMITISQEGTLWHKIKASIAGLLMGFVGFWLYPNIPLPPIWAKLIVILLWLFPTVWLAETEKLVRAFLNGLLELVPWFVKWIKERVQKAGSK